MPENERNESRRPVVFGSEPPLELNPQAQAYLRTRVFSATPEELRLMLLDGAIRFATQGVEGLDAKDFEKSCSGLARARDIVLELMTTIKRDPDPELADRVKAVYAFIYQELVESSFEKDAARGRKAIELLEFERETWQLLMDRLHEDRSGGAARAAPTTAPASPKPVAARPGAPAPAQRAPAPQAPAAGGARRPLSVSA